MARGTEPPMDPVPSPLSPSLTCSTFSSLSSVKTVPSIWLGFRATQLKTGMRNLVWIGFFTFTAGSRGGGTSQGGGSQTHPRVPPDPSQGTPPPSPGHTHLNHWQWGGHPARLGAPHRGVGVVEGGARGPPAPPGAVGGVVALGHPGVGGLGEGRCLRAEGVRGVGGGWAQPPAEVGGAEGVEVGGQQVLVGEVGLEPEPEHLQGKEEVGEMVTQQGTVPSPHSPCHRITLSPRAHLHTPTSVSVPRDSLPPLLGARCPRREGDIPSHPRYLCRWRWCRWWQWPLQKPRGLRGFL